MTELDITTQTPELIDFRARLMTDDAIANGEIPEHAYDATVERNREWLLRQPREFWYARRGYIGHSNY